MTVRRLASIDQIAPQQWDACFAAPDAAPDTAPNPFLSHAFLSALEQHGAVTAERGWTPAHVVLEDATGRLLAAAPAYLKAHSWGEFVFDFGWAEAAQRAGIRYYPKLLCAVPFTPVTGPRLGAPDAATRRRLAQALRQAAVDCGASSLHALFLNEPDREPLQQLGCVERRDIQFHWLNPGYADFEGFLANLRHDRRKKIRRERRRIAEAGLSLSWAHGEALSEAAWHSVYQLYAHTYLERGRSPYLPFEFFADYARQRGTPVRVLSVHSGQQRIAAAIFMRGGDTLYGRHWGAQAHYHSLHFEACYYQGVDYCIRHQLRHFDAGAQGGHKLLRGFAPRATHSAHWIADARLAEAVDRAMVRERRAVSAEQSALQDYLPYHRDANDANGDKGSAGGNDG